MNKYLFVIKKTNYGYKISKNKSDIVIFKSITIFLLLFLGISLVFIDFEIAIFQMNILIKIISCMLLVFGIYYTIFSKKTIYVDNNNIVFCLKIKYWKKENVKLQINNIIEISINYEIKFEEDTGETYYYNLDLIDINYNAYRLGQSRDYNKILNFGKEIENILNKKLIDKNHIEGYGNIFKKRIV